MLIVVFSNSDGEQFKKNIPDHMNSCVIGPIGDYIDIKSASEEIMKSDVVSFVHESMVVDFDVLINGMNTLSGNNKYGIVYFDYLRNINRATIPRLRRSYKKKKNNCVPVFGSVISGDLVPVVLSELVGSDKLEIDSFLSSELDGFTPYHAPRFAFKI